VKETTLKESKDIQLNVVYIKNKADAIASKCVALSVYKSQCSSWHKEMDVPVTTAMSILRTGVVFGSNTDS